MNYSDRIVNIGKVNLCLPEFSPQDVAEAELMNSFFRRLEEEILSYVSSSPVVRRYSTSFNISFDEKKILVSVKLCGRLINDCGSIMVQKKELQTIWQGAKLTMSCKNIT